MCSLTIECVLFYYIQACSFAQQLLELERATILWVLASDRFLRGRQQWRARLLSLHVTVADVRSVCRIREHILL